MSTLAINLEDVRDAAECLRGVVLCGGNLEPSLLRLWEPHR
ncbi:MAG: hypothetical protein ACUVS4_01920 [Chloroflexaceae bacterium]